MCNKSLGVTTYISLAEIVGVHVLSSPKSTLASTQKSGNHQVLTQDLGCRPHTTTDGSGVASDGVGKRGNLGQLRPADESSNSEEIANCEGCADGGGSDQGCKVRRDGPRPDSDPSNVKHGLMSDRCSCNPATFHWKGQNYLEKMSHDLEFLTDDSSSSSANLISTWLGFSAIRNPFLLPPESHDVCKSLQLEHEQLRESAASRRTQRRRESLRRHWADSEASSRRRSRTTSLTQEPESNTTNTGENGGDQHVGVMASCMVDAQGVVAADGIGLGPAKTEANTESGSADLLSLGGDFGAVSERRIDNIACVGGRAKLILSH